VIIYIALPARTMDALGALACYDDADEAGGSSSVRRAAPFHSPRARTRAPGPNSAAARLLRSGGCRHCGSAGRWSACDAGVCTPPAVGCSEEKMGNGAKLFVCVKMGCGNRQGNRKGGQRSRGPK